MRTLGEDPGGDWAKVETWTGLISFTELGVGEETSNVGSKKTIKRHENSVQANTVLDDSLDSSFFKSREGK